MAGLSRGGILFSGVLEVPRAIALQKPGPGGIEGWLTQLTVHSGIT